MALDVAKFRKLVAMDPNDALARFGLGRKLYDAGTPEALAEAAEHLRIANAGAPEHVATYHVLAQVLIQLGEIEEARQVLQAGRERAAQAPHGMGNDLEPILADLLASL